METDGPDRALLSGAWHAHVSNHGTPLLDFNALTSRLNEVHTAWGTCAAPKKAAPRRAAPPPPRSHGAGLGGHTRAPSAPPPSAAARISAKPVVASARALGNVSDDTARNLGRATSFLCRHLPDRALAKGLADGEEGTRVDGLAEPRLRVFVLSRNRSHCDHLPDLHLEGIGRHFGEIKLEATLLDYLPDSLAKRRIQLSGGTAQECNGFTMCSARSR